MELVLDPMAFPPAQVYQQALCEAGIPATALITQGGFPANSVARVRAVIDPTTAE